MRRSSNSRFWAWTGAAVLAAGLAAPARAQDPDDQRRGVARVSLINNDVSIGRGDSGDWVAASVNAPVMTGDRISTGANSRAEVEFDSANALRIGGDAVVSFEQLEAGRSQMAVSRGTVTFRVLRSSNVDIEVDTPSVAVRPLKQGAYRIAVDESGETEITARSGEVEVFTPQGSEWVRSGQTMTVRGPATDPEFQTGNAAPRDDWDRWNDSRDQALARSVSPHYVGPGVYGAEDLDMYGSWVSVPPYGYVWRPLVVPGWAPYRQGRWVWEDWYGWTWVSYEPWGWAPYHYGRWFNDPAYGWLWYPGAISVPHYWSPGLVAFFGFGGGGVGFGIGNVGWVPLAPYEVLHPWWGRGFYGPAYVNRSINITTVNITAAYRNARVTNGITAVSGADFRGGRFTNFVPASAEQVHDAGLVRGAMPIAPGRSNLKFSDRQTAFVPRAVTTTRIFTRQQPTPAPRVSFAEQRRAYDPTAAEGPGRSGEPGAPAATPREPASSGGWQRFGESRGSGNRTSEAAPAGTPGFNRFGSPSAGTAGTAQPRTAFRSEAPASGGGNAEPRSTPPRQPESLRISPPVVRERPSGGASSGGGSPARSGNSGSHGNSGNNHGGHNR